MPAISIIFPDEAVPQDRLALLLKHFSQIEDDREPWRVMYPLGGPWWCAMRTACKFAAP